MKRRKVENLFLFIEILIKSNIKCTLFALNKEAPVTGEGEFNG